MIAVLKKVGIPIRLLHESHARSAPTAIEGMPFLLHSGVSGMLMPFFQTRPISDLTDRKAAESPREETVWITGTVVF